MDPDVQIRFTQDKSESENKRSHEEQHVLKSNIFPTFVTIFHSKVQYRSRTSGVVERRRRASNFGVTIGQTDRQTDRQTWFYATNCSA